MSYLVDPTEPDYLNDKAEDSFLSENETEDYNFKYVPASQFKYIVKDVRRQRCREEEDSVWASFVKQQELNGMTYNKNNIQSSVQSIKELLNENMQEADKELKKFETDVFPDRIRRECSNAEINQKTRSKVNNIRDSSPKKMPIIRDPLLTISKEENTRIPHSRQGSGNFKSKTRKSCSSHTVAQRLRSKQHFHTTNGVEYNSSPENSTYRDHTANGVIYIRPDPFTMNKITTMQKRVDELLDEIAYRLGNIPVPDGIKDLQRRQQYVAEFAIRFSRNYLYDLNRYVKDIQRHMYIISPRARIKPNYRSLGLHMHAIEHKLLGAHQLLLHALIAYCKHIPSSILGEHAEKLKEILQIVIDLKTMYDRLQLNYLESGDNDILSLGKDIESKCNTILTKLKLQPDNDLLIDSNKTPSITTCSQYSITNKNHFNHKQLSNRLSMYNIDTKVLKNNPKHRNNCYQRKNKKYNTVDIKGICKKPIQYQQYRPKTVRSSKDVTQRLRKGRIYAKEEDIKTMMDILPIDSDNISNIGIEGRNDNIIRTKRKSKVSEKSPRKLQDLTQSESMEKIVTSTCTNIDDELVKKVTMITEEHLSNLVPVIANLISVMSTKKYESSKIDDARDPSEDSSCEQEHLKTDRTLCETQKSGENMQLICMSSIEDTMKVPRYCNASCQVNCENTMPLSDFETKVREGKRIRDSLGSIELIVFEETETNFLKYKHEYQSSMQSIPMYSSNTQNKPWDIVAWISDKLVDDLIVEIAKELQIDDVIQKLFELEFQEF